jgi:molecular chaperone GrpE
MNDGENNEEIQENPQNEETISSGDSSVSDDTWALLAEIEKLKASLARSQADYQNLVMRSDRDKADMIHFLSAKIILPLLTHIDNLERAVKLKEWTEGDTFVDGVRSVFNGFTKYLESQWVASFDSIGSEVDPEKHDVMTEMAGESGKIIQEFEKWYTLWWRVIRHAKVVVGNGN